MKFPVLLAMMAAVFSLTACETATKKQMPNGYVIRQSQDFLATGRGLSDGAVDLYRPGTDFLPTAEFPTTGKRVNISPIAVNTNIISKDPSVTIFSLDTMEIMEPQEPPLPPQAAPGVPAIQPPVNLQSDYPSPFDKNGNPIP